MKYNDLYDYIKENAGIFGEFHSITILQLDDLTLNTTGEKILFILNEDAINKRGEYTNGGQIHSKYNLQFFIIQNLKEDANTKEVNEQYDEMDSIANQFIYRMNKPNIIIRQIEDFSTRKLRWLTSNSFGGVELTIPELEIVGC